MGQERGALPGTIRTASVVLRIDGLAAFARGLATVSLNGLSFNECDAPAHFSTLDVHHRRQGDLRLSKESSGDVVEEWPRWSVQREVTLQIENLGATPIAARDIELLLIGYPPAPTPASTRFGRQPRPAVVNTGAPVTARTGQDIALDCQWHQMPLAPVRRVLQVAPHRVRVPQAGQNYTISLDFFPRGGFSDVGYSAVLRTHEAKVVVTEELNAKRLSLACWMLYVPTDAPAGSYGGPLDLELTATLAGFGWSGGGESIDNGVWSDLQAVA